MDNIIQIEKLRYARMFRVKTFFHDLINHCLEKSENLKPQGSPRALKQPQKVFVNVAVRKIPLETPQWISVFVAGNTTSYLQKLNCAASCS